MQNHKTLIQYASKLVLEQVAKLLLIDTTGA